MYCVDEFSISIFDTLRFALFSSNAPVLLYYSHFTAIVVSIVLSFFVLYNNRRSFGARILAVISTLFSLWAVADILLWTQIDSRILMFVWSFWFIFFITIFVLSFYFLYTFIKKRDMPFGMKILFFLVLAPVLLLSPTRYNLSAFDIPGCTAIESTLMINLVYILAAVVFCAVCMFGIREYYKTQDKTFKRQIFLSTMGVALFLLCFSVATYIASIANLFSAEPDTFLIEQYGYFGMTIFIAFLTYIIVKYQAFNIKLIATQALVVTLMILIGSQFFFIKSDINKVLNVITLALSIGFGILIVKSVKREIRAKEALAVANDRLKELDKQKTEFVSFATHQLRSPLTSIKGNTSLILEGDLGPLSKPLKDVVETIYISVKTMINVVEDYLNISRIELGTMKYTFVEMDFKEILKEVVNEQKPNIEAKGLSCSVSLDENQTYKIKADPDKFKQVVMNTIDNSIKYTKKGSIELSLEGDIARGVVRLKIADTGVGIAPDVIPKLFQKFTRAANANEANIHGTGLGLYIAKEIMSAHGGKIWAESDGEDKGSRFYVEIPLVK